MTHFANERQKSTNQPGQVQVSKGFHFTHFQNSVTKHQNNRMNYKIYAKC